MPPDMVDGNARRDLVDATVERHATGKHLAHHGDDIVDLERFTQVWVAHAAPGDVFHFKSLQMVAGLRAKIVVSGMVIMQMAHDHVADLVGSDVDGLESPGDRIEHLALALLSRRRIETGIDDEGAPRSNDGPDEIVKRLEQVVGVAAYKIVR
jgi:hypothetical protein